MAAYERYAFRSNNGSTDWVWLAAWMCMVKKFQFLNSAM
jgi:hypothetical protein